MSDFRDRLKQKLAEMEAERKLAEEQAAAEAQAPEQQQTEEAPNAT